MRKSSLLALAGMYGLMGDMTLTSPQMPKYTTQASPSMQLTKRGRKNRKKAKAASKARNKNRR